MPRNSKDEDSKRRPRYAGEYTEHLKHEDATASLEVELPQTGTLLSLVCVADGHGGVETSRWLSDNVLELIAAKAGDASREALQSACITAFAEADAAVKALETGEVSQGGTIIRCGSTLTVVIVNHQRREVTCANVGDSEAVLVRSDGYEALSTSHRLDHNTDECERVVAQGHRIARAMDPDGMPGGPQRAWPGGLAVTRGIGDSDCAYVTCEPEVKTVQAPPHGCVVVVGSDGVWDAVQLPVVYRLMSSSSYQWTSPRQAARAVVRRAIKQSGLYDDVSAVTLFIDSADPRSPTSFISDHFKANRAPFYRRAFLHGSSALTVAASGMDGSKHEEFEVNEEETSKYGGDAFSADMFSDMDESKTSTVSGGCGGSSHGGGAAFALLSQAEEQSMGGGQSPRLRISRRNSSGETLEEKSDRAMARGRRVSHDDFGGLNTSSPTPLRSRTSGANGSSTVLAEASNGSSTAFAEASKESKLYEELCEKTFDALADGVDPELRMAAEKSFRARTPKAGLGGLSSGMLDIIDPEVARSQMSSPIGGGAHAPAPPRSRPRR